MADVTAAEQRKKFEAQASLKTEESVDHKTDPADALVLYPALGNPALVKKDAEGKDKNGNTAKVTILDLVLLSRSDKLTCNQVADHLKISPWSQKDKAAAVNDKTILKHYIEDITAVNLSGGYPASNDELGLGLEGKDVNDGSFGVKFSHISPFPWILKGLSDFPYLYKVSINLKDMAPGMYNIWWVNAVDYLQVRKRRKWWNFIKYVNDWLSGAAVRPWPFMKELKEYGGDVVNDELHEELNENIKAAIYHPFFVTTKESLSIGHVTDVHLDSRMELYGQCEASVIEVEENCPPKAQGTRRDVSLKKFHRPIKEKIANFNAIFTDICLRLKEEKNADILVITGDLVDYNRGMHAPSTYRTCFTPISEMWDALSSDVKSNRYYKNDRNWFQFYKKLVELYDKKQVPVYTLLGNHDYVNYGMAPWPLWGVPWNGVFDQNLTLYESALCFGPGYDNSKAFINDVFEKSDFVQWYSIFINPFSDFVVNYGDLSLLMVDWGVKSNVVGHGLKSAVVEPVIPGYKAAGGLHHARHLFRKKGDYDRATSSGDGADTTVENYEPFPVRNYSIYESWIKQKDKVKILFMHATGICPRDDISIGQVNHDLTWKNNELKYGSFDYRRDEILKNVEDGSLNLIVAGHSHRNVVMEVKGNPSGKVTVLGDGETYGKITRPARNLVMVTSSAGPLPKCIPGGPLICACPEKYAHGWDYTQKTFGESRFYEYTYGDTRDDLSHLKKEDRKCPRCGMPAKDMTRKIAKRHRPGGSILTFEGRDKDGFPEVTIESVPTLLHSAAPRMGVQNDEHDIFTEDLKLEDINSYKDYHFWDDDEFIRIISKKPFKYYGYMAFPDKVQYVTFLNGKGEDRGLRGEINYNVGNIDLRDNRKLIEQEVGKDDFKFLMRSARRDSDFAFMRYIYKSSPEEFWDREITMYKEIPVVDSQELKDFSEEKIDQFEGLAIKFIRKIDHKKRKEICGY